MSRSATKRLQQLNADRERSAGAGPPSFRPPNDDTVVTPIAFAAGAILIFVLIAALAVVSGTFAIERDLKAETERALRTADFQDITAQISGFDVTLLGYYLDSRTVDEVVAAVASVSGVREVDAGALYPVALPEGNDPEGVVGRPLTFGWKNGALTISGDVSSEGIRSYLESEPATFATEDGAFLFRSISAGDLVVVEDLAPIDGLAEESDWAGNTMALLRSLGAGLDEGSIVVNPSGKVVITSGEVETRQEKRDIDEAAEAPTQALIGNGFVVTPGIIRPPDRFVATQEEVEEVTATLTQLIGDKVVEFELNSAALTAEGQALLDEILVVLRDVPNVPVEIAGHADASGTVEHNLELSKWRAEAVLAYFLSKGEVAERFVVVYFGDTQPIPGGTPEQNRRIEFNPQEG